MATLAIAIATAAIAAGSLAYSLYISRKAQNNQNRMRPASLDDFGMTQSTEGQAVPLIYGQCRINGSLLWYGNLVTEEITEGGGGKGGGGEQVTGYKYYLDCWQLLGLGKLEIVSIYQNDDKTPIESGATVFNNGTGYDYPTEPGEFSTRLPGVAHVFYRRWFVGENTTTLPVVHFVVERILPTTVNQANLPSGSNPAAAIYDVLLKAGADQSDIDLASFNAAAAYYADQEYGINIVFNGQQEAAEIINKIIGYVDGALYIDINGKFALKAFDPAESALYSLVEDDFENFKFTRRSYHEMHNDFKGTFKDDNQDHTRRGLTWDNPAHIRLVGRKKPKSVDLAVFTDIEVGSKRLTEIGKRESYPLAEIEFTTNLAFEIMYPGDPITVSYSDPDLSNVGFRVISVDYSGVDKNEVGFKAVQRLETLFDSNFMPASGSKWKRPSREPVALVKQAVFELPYNSAAKDAPAFLVLAAREKLFETSYQVIFSTSGLDYKSAGELTTWGQAGTLDTDYPATTRDIDDDTGILFTPYKDDPVFSTISRTDLFFLRRVAVIDDEMLCFQTVTPEGIGSYRLTGVLRGVMGTAKAAHLSNAEIWIVEITEKNVLQKAVPDSFYLKLLPRFAGKTLDAGSATAIAVTVQYNAAKPRSVARIEATRAGSTVSVQLFPSTPGTPGAGDMPETWPGAGPPFPFEGDFSVDDGLSVVYKNMDSFDIANAGAFTLTVKHRRNGYESDGLDCYVDTADGIYIGT